MPARAERTFTEPRVLIQHLQEVRGLGYVLDDQENEANIRCIGAVMLGPRGLLIASVRISSLIYDLSGTKVGRCAQLVVAAARSDAG